MNIISKTLFWFIMCWLVMFSAQSVNASSFAFKRVYFGPSSSEEKDQYLRYTARTGLIELGNLVARSGFTLVDPNISPSEIKTEIRSTVSDNFIAFDKSAVTFGTKISGDDTKLALVKVYAGTEPSTTTVYVIKSTLSNAYIKCDGGNAVSTTLDIQRACPFEFAPLGLNAQLLIDQPKFRQYPDYAPLLQGPVALRKAGGEGLVSANPNLYLRYTHSTGVVAFGQMVLRSIITLVNPRKSAREIHAELKFNASDNLLSFKGTAEFEGTKVSGPSTKVVLEQIDFGETPRYVIRSEISRNYLRCVGKYAVAQTTDKGKACEFEFSSLDSAKSIDLGIIPEFVVKEDRNSPFYLDRLNIDLNIGLPIRKSFALLGAQKNLLKLNPVATRTPDIYIVFVDTLRKDYLDKYAPRMREFLNKNISPKYHWSSGTATVYSTFSMFHSLPPFLTYDYGEKVLDDAKDYGAFPLKVLQKLGYDLHVYGFEWGCLNPNGTLKRRNWTTGKYESSYWDIFLRSYFGEKSNMLLQCRTDTVWENWGDKLDRAVRDNWDHVTVSTAKKDIAWVNKNLDTPHFYFINLYNVHGPHRWNPGMPDPIIPSVNNRQTGTLYNIQPSPQVLENSFANSVRSADDNFGEILEFIDKQKNGDDAIIVLVSDHGEMLGEKHGQTGHGKRAYRERNEAVMGIRFGQDTALLKNQPISDVFSSLDLFPTIFDYMNINPKVDAGMVGKSLLKGQRNSGITVRANQSAPTYEMTLSNNKYKLYVHIDVGINQYSNAFPPETRKTIFDKAAEKFYKGINKVRVFDITDLNDKPVFNLPPFSPHCDPSSSRQSKALCRELLLEMFSDAFKELFPDL